MITQNDIRKMHRGLNKLGIEHTFIDEPGRTDIRFDKPYDLGGDMHLYYFPFQGLCALNDGTITYSKNYEGRLEAMQYFNEIMEAVKSS